MIPGGVFPGVGGNDYSEELGGVDCYTCDFCPIEPFDPDQLQISTRSGCNVCSKEFDNSKSFVLVFSDGRQLSRLGMANCHPKC